MTAPRSRWAAGPPHRGPAFAAITARCAGCGAVLGEPARGRGPLIERADAGDPAALAALADVRAAMLAEHCCPGAAIVAAMLGVLGRDRGR